ncbi:NUDIX hydrolase [Chloroflexota bacterium]
MSEETIRTSHVFSGRAIRLRVDTILEKGRETTREIVEHDECVAVVAEDNNGDILLVRQFRKAIEKELLEIPAGGIDPGEGAPAAVIREMQEETGYKPARVVRLAGFYLSPGFSNEYLHLYLATELTESRLYAEDTDGIKIVRVPPDDIHALLTSGEVEDAKTIAGLLYYLKYHQNRPIEA